MQKANATEPPDVSSTRLQPGGLVLCVSLDDWRIIACGGDAGVPGLTPRRGDRVADAVGVDIAHELRNLSHRALRPGRPGWSVHAPGALSAPCDGLGCALLASDQMLLVEIEPEDPALAMAPQDLADVAARLDAAADPDAALHDAVRMLRMLSDWDGVAVWHSDGTLAAAAGASDLAPPPPAVHRAWGPAGRIIGDAQAAGGGGVAADLGWTAPKDFATGGLAAPSPEERDWLSAAKLTAAAGFELRLGGRTTGHVAFVSRTPRRMGPGARAALSIVLPNLAGWLSEAPGAPDGRAEGREALASDEAAHRLSNVFAMVSALIRVAAAGERDVDRFAEAVTERVRALAAANAALDAPADDDLDLSGLLRQAVSPYLSSRGPDARFSGPTVFLQARQAAVLGLIAHELVTNAVKHGALSHAGGRLTVAWSLDDDGDLLLDWREEGGLADRPGPGGGLGSALLKRLIEDPLAGRFEREIRDEGVIIRLTLPADALRAAPRTSPPGPQQAAAAPDPGGPAFPSRPLANLRVLIVEDDALQAMDLEEMARALGAVDVAVAARTQEALDAIAQGRPDISLLDHALSESTSLPVAERLAELGLPFAVTSGRRAARLPDLMAQAPTLQKPASTASLVQVLRRLLPG